MAVLGKLVHYSIDLALISTALAGIRRTTGLTPRIDNPSGTVGMAVKRYLEVGELVIDHSSAWLASTKYFKRE
ncbi:hypothetical protein LPJ56_006232 [Coemansia sp. RSA 2599]|nr:hypothetical protein LPJ75_006272 [Coemansia sp. RSA 2598]KAJ1802189.1 hypothetical protein LPJ75_006262 [Coemansia sp. RSA 2598]KAJ1807431.1 hypothetical protein LPJ56_006243 [Coemansia sp. RSA 2599]KAJ1807493.1 hypothetical protein LPJ56_006232 [Coemansia sp. RSA 2599]